MQTMRPSQKAELVNESWWNDLTEDEFQETFRMSRQTLTDLQAEIDHCEGVYLNRTDKTLLACIWLLGNTEPFKEAERLFKIDDVQTSMRTCVMKILKLGSFYILWPSPNEAKQIELGFIKAYHFPGLVGVIGSLHIGINKDHNTEDYYNHITKKNTLVLQIVCDDNLLLRDVCVGCPGGKSIKEILECSPLFEILTDQNSLLVKHHLHLLGGTEHPQLNTLLTPYTFAAGRKLTQRQCKFNELHSTVMCTVEQTFRCLKNRFPRLTVDNLNLEMATLIASSICVLHNFTRVRGDHCDLYLQNF